MFGKVIIRDMYSSQERFVDASRDACKLRKITTSEQAVNNFHDLVENLVSLEGVRLE